MKPPCLKQPHGVSEDKEHPSVSWMYPVVFSSFSHHIPTNYWLYSSMDFLHVYVCWFCWLNFHVCCVSWWLKHPPDGCWYCSGDHQWSSQPTSWTVPFRPPVPSPNESWWIGCGYPFPVPGCLDPGFLVDLHMDLMVILIGNIYWRAFKPGRILGVATMCKQTQIYSQTERGRRKNHVPWNGDIIGM